jgi:tetratricopeptide (TPR) repeat protein
MGKKTVLRHQKISRSASNRSEMSRQVAALTYFTAIAAFLTAPFVSDWRVWGFNWWAYYPVWVLAGLAVLGVGAGIGVLRWSQRTSDTETAFSQVTLTSVAICLIVLAGFILLPSATHFTGDGYQLLAQLGSGSASMKTWDVGADAVNRAFYGLLSGEPRNRALSAFRIESVVAGCLVLLGLLVLLPRLFKDALRRLLFLVGFLTGGYMLLFFGYVENYAFLITLEILYCLGGILVANKQASPWWLLVVLAPAVVLHVFSVAMIPSLAYLFLHETRLAQLIWGSVKRRLPFFTLLAVVVGLVAYFLLRRSSLFFTFALLPPVPDRFTVEGDWLMSPKHIVDLVNLMILLSPSLLLLPAGLLLGSAKSHSSSKETPFLVILCLCTLATVYVFNPGIGMPRNWDLFAIAGPPLVAATYRYFLRPEFPRRMAVLLSGFAIALSVLLLGPRVVAHATPQLGIDHFRDYLALDAVRNRNARRLLVDYYKGIGDSAQAEIERSKAEADFPEIILGKKARAYMAQGKYREAMSYLHRAIDINPLYYDAYGNLGLCHLQTGRADSARALLEIADGINPLNAPTISNLGTVFLRMSDYGRAEKQFMEALRIDSTYSRAMAGLSSVYTSTGRYSAVIPWLEKLAADTSYPAEYFRQAGNALLEENAFVEAAKAYRIALTKGLDSTYVQSKLPAYPQLLKQ